MADLQKHRDEDETFEVSMSANLDDGESLTGTPTVRVAQRHATISGEWVDVSSEFAVADEALNGTSDGVTFTLGQRSGAGQTAGDDYVCWVSCATDGGRTLVETPSLEVKGEGAT